MSTGESTDSDALARLAASVDRPPASLSAFSGLSPEQLLRLADAIESTSTRRQLEVDSELTRALPQLPGPTVIKLLRGPGLAPLRRRLRGRRQAP